MDCILCDENGTARESQPHHVRAVREQHITSVFPFPLSLSLCVSAIPHSGLVSANALLSQVEKVKDDTTDQVFNLTTRRDASFKIRVSYLVNAEAGAGAGGGAERQAL